MGPGWAPDARNIDNIGPSEANTGTAIIAIHKCLYPDIIVVYHPGQTTSNLIETGKHRVPLMIWNIISHRQM